MFPLASPHFVGFLIAVLPVVFFFWGKGSIKLYCAFDFFEGK